MLCGKTIKNFFEQLLNFGIAFVRHNLFFFQEQQKEVHSHLQMCHRFRHTAMTVDAAFAKFNPAEKEVDVQAFDKFLFSFIGMQKSLLEPLGVGIHIPLKCSSGGFFLIGRKQLKIHIGAFHSQRKVSSCAAFANVGSQTLR